MRPARLNCASSQLGSGEGGTAWGQPIAWCRATQECDYQSICRVIDDAKCMQNIYTLQFDNRERARACAHSLATICISVFCVVVAGVCMCVCCEHAAQFRFAYVRAARVCAALGTLLLIRARADGERKKTNKHICWAVPGGRVLDPRCQLARISLVNNQNECSQSKYTKKTQSLNEWNQHLYVNRLLICLRAGRCALSFNSDDAL